MIPRCLALIAAVLTFALPARAADVKTLDFTWRDAARDREVPVRIYYEAALTTPAPVIIFSHGLGGSREGYAYLGRHWATNGFVSVHPQHAGSDAAVLKNGGKLTEAVTGLKALENASARAHDITFVIDRLADAYKNDAALKGRLRMDAIGIAGHSFGAQTTLLAAGMTMAGKSFADPRIKAALAMSPQPPAAGERAFRGVKIPVFHMTGTQDTTPLPGLTTTPEDRLKPFQWITGVDQALLVLTNGDHMVFSGRLAAARPSDAPMQEQIKKASTAWWKARLLSESASDTWLHDTFPKELGNAGRCEFKKAVRKEP
jgi:predicted dienelactone hydrolase